MGTSVLQCKRCKKYYADFFEDKKRMKLLARIHKADHDGNSTKDSSPHAAQAEGVVEHHQYRLA